MLGSKGLNYKQQKMRMLKRIKGARVNERHKGQRKERQERFGMGLKKARLASFFQPMLMLTA